MEDLRTATARPDSTPPEYATALAELEWPAMRGQLALAQLRREVHALRERYTGGWPVALCSSRQRH